MERCAAESLCIKDIAISPVGRDEEARFQALMQAHHYLGALPKIGECRWYVARWHDQWVALLSFSAAAMKCRARDRWIGWEVRHQYDRLHLLANNSRFLILPDWHVANLASRTLGLCQRRLSSDWVARFGHPLVLLETFVDPQRFLGTIYRAANWREVGLTRGFRRTRDGYSKVAQSPKRVFVYPLQADAQAVLSAAVLNPPYRHGVPKMMLTADQMRSLPDYFAAIPDPRRTQGRRHPLPSVLGIAAGAILCGMRGYKAISDWAQALSPTARERFRCRLDRAQGRRLIPSEYVIRDLLVRIDPAELDRALQRWNADHGTTDASLAIDGKTMCNALDEQGRQTHIMSAIGHQTRSCYTQKKSAPSP